MSIYNKVYVLGHQLEPTLDVEGGALSHPYMMERTYKKADGKEVKYYNKIPFKSYKIHQLDPEATYPYLDWSKKPMDEGILSFIALRLEPVSQYDVFDYPVGKTIGNISTNIFMEDFRIKTKNDKGISRYDFWNNKETRKEVYERTYMLRYNDLIDPGKKVAQAYGNKSVYNHDKPELMFKELRDVSLRPGMDHFIGAANQFKPFVAKVIYDYFKDSIGANGTVLDFSAGWGGRCIGALASDLNYIGVDSNTDLITPYAEMLDLYKPYYKNNATIFFTQSENVDFSKLKYDFVLTSPPYLSPTSNKQIEDYANMKKYSQMSFYTDFLYPVIANIFEHLPDKKWMCINTNDSDGNVIIDTLMGQPDMVFNYKIKSRAGTAKKEEKYAELCYCWQKTDKLMKLVRQKIKQHKINTEGYKDAEAFKDVSVKGTGQNIGDEKAIYKKLYKERHKRNKDKGIEEGDDEGADPLTETQEIELIPYIAEATTVNTPIIPSIMPSKATNTTVENLKPYKEIGLRIPNELVYKRPEPIDK
jgi:hypothetical protein